MIGEVVHFACEAAIGPIAESTEIGGRFDRGHARQREAAFRC
jgi:hypothetical protein